MDRYGRLSGWWAALAAVLVLSLLALEVWLAFVEQGGRGASGAADITVRAASDGLEVRAWPDHSTVRRGDTVRVYFTVTNTSPAPLAAVLLERLDATGLEAVGECWDGTRITCGGPPLPRLPPGASLSRWGDLRVRSSSTPGLPARARPPSLTVAVLVATAASNGTERIEPAPHAAIVVGPLAIDSFSRGQIVARGVLGFFRDLALPILLGFLAFGFQRLQQEKSRLDETYNVILPKAFENATRYLLPVVSALNGFQREAAELRRAPGDAERLRKALFYVLSALRAWRELARQGAGGIFFSRLVAEEAVLYLHRACWIVLQDTLGAAHLSAVLDAMEPQESLSSLYDKLGAGMRQEQTAFRAVEERFSAWLNDAPSSDPYCSLLTTLATAIQRECDVLLAPWYREDAVMHPTSIETAITVVAQLRKVTAGESAAGVNLARLATALVVYLDDVKGGNAAKSRP